MQDEPKVLWIELDYECSASEGFDAVFLRPLRQRTAHGLRHRHLGAAHLRRMQIPKGE